MSNEYRVTSLMNFGLPGVEVTGNAFNAKDIYDLIGKEQYSSTFSFKVDSPAFKEYGENLTGFACYDPKTKALLGSGHSPNEMEVIQQLKIDVMLGELSAAQKHKLRYKGVSISDIESISFLQHKQKMEFHPMGEKKIPNVVEIKADLGDFDHDTLLINYLTSKHNRGVELIGFEREQLVGLLLARDDFNIDTLVLNALGFSAEQVKGSHAIWHHAYKSLDRHGRITQERTESFREMQLLDSLTRLNALASELKISGALDLTGIDQSEQLKKICEQVIKFNPSILMHGLRQVYWDLQSYIHIALRHVKDYQLGLFKGKTPFLYKSNDISSLIQKVLGCIEEDLQIYLAEYPARNFKRHGSMAIEFNGDYYNISIEPSGRLEQFHMIGNV
ncbi:hypothetical protein [Hydrogenophaga taeniospiralis]|uniref:hypothetical protein n=1 Tax=Hydrogenophaga taeniospiralis TaxID=65656 RepID=UPI001CFC3F9B|nr:hypothetical protein [Hydrogenophaga taeniospiralis]UCU92546.1 hypothetical protein KI616_17100 [Hydrogenophaga taeniospiralis]